MTPKEKAQELIAKFSAVGLQQRNEGIQCALIHVNEMIDNGNLEPQVTWHIGVIEPKIIHLEYWFKVKQEIEKL